MTPRSSLEEKEKEEEIWLEYIKNLKSAWCPCFVKEPRHFKYFDPDLWLIKNNKKRNKYLKSFL